MTVTAVERPAHLDKPWTAAEVLRGLFCYLTPLGWAPHTEVSDAMPDRGRDRPGGCPSPYAMARRIDMLAIRQAPTPGRPLERLAIEVKVSRRDFRADLRNPDKQASWRELSELHAYAAPAGLIDPDEVPDDSGLLVATRLADHPFAPARIQWAKRPPLNPEPALMPEWLVMRLLYRGAWAEAHRKGLVP